MHKECVCQKHKPGVEEEARGGEMSSPLSPMSNAITMQQPAASHPEGNPT